MLHPGDAYSQTVTAFCESIAAVKKLGGKSEDIVRVKMFVRREEDADAVGKGMKDTLSGAWAATMIVGVGFVNREMLVEVEVDAVVEL